MDGRFYPYHAGGPSLLAWLVFAVLVALLALAVAYAATRLGRGRVSAAPAVVAPADDALAVLRLRYARGEIAREEYLRASDDLSGGAPPTAPAA